MGSWLGGLRVLCCCELGWVSCWVGRHRGEMDIQPMAGRGLGWLERISLPPDWAMKKVLPEQGWEGLGEIVPEEDAASAVGPFKCERGVVFEDGWSVGEEGSVPEI